MSTTGQLILAAAVVLLAACGDGGKQADEVEIVRDRWGVPHLFVSDPSDTGSLRLAFATGYVQAQDRLFQMDLLRHAALGRLTEFFGNAVLDMDRDVRRDGLSAEEQSAQFGELPPDVRDLLEAHVAGVNAWIERLAERPDLLPADYGIIDQTPEMWEPADIVALAVFEFGIFGSAGGTEVDNAKILLDLLDRFPAPEARGIFDDLFWFDDPDSPTSLAAADVSPF